MYKPFLWFTAKDFHEKDTWSDEVEERTRCLISYYATENTANQNVGILLYYFVGISPNVPIVYCIDCVGLCILWQGKIVVQSFRVVYQGIVHISLVFLLLSAEAEC